MITGLKLAYNPAAYHLQISSHDFSVRPGVDLTLVDPPIKAGLELSRSAKHTTGTSFDGGTDIVFAYQLVEIDYRVGRSAAGI